MYDLFNKTDELKNDMLLTGASNDLIDSFLNGSFNLTEIYNTFNRTIDFESTCRKDFLNYLITAEGN